MRPIPFGPRLRRRSWLRPFPTLRFEPLESRYAPATFTWTGNGLNNLWSNAANWVGGAAPTGNPAEVDDLAFPAGAAQFTAQNDIVGGTFDSLTFAAGGYTLSGKALTLGVPSVPGSGFVVVNALATGVTIGIDVRLGASAGSEQSFSVLNGADLTLTGRLSGSTGATFTKDGQGTITFTADNSGFTGTIRLNNNSGALVVTNPNSLGDLSSPTIVGFGSSLRVSGGGTYNEPLILNGLGVANDGALLNLGGTNTWAGAITLDSTTALGAAAGVLNVSGAISDTGAGFGLFKEGPAEVQLSAANTYRGLTTVDNGILTVRNPLALGASGSASNGTVVNSGSGGSILARLTCPSDTINKCDRPSAR
jgi:autotransporter-associated beta strand protein